MEQEKEIAALNSLHALTRCLPSVSLQVLPVAPAVSVSAGITRVTENDRTNVAMNK